MAKRQFTMRLQCRYQDPDNSIAELIVEVLTADGWQTLDLSVNSPGFQVFVYSVFACQHKYFHVNCAERGLMLTNSEGNLIIKTSRDWEIESLWIEFTGYLKSGSVIDEDIDYILERMKQCPVSKNLLEVNDSQAKVQLIPL